MSVGGRGVMCGGCGGGSVNGERVCVCCFANVAGFHGNALHRVPKDPFFRVHRAVLKKKGIITSP